MSTTSQPSARIVEARALSHKLPETASSRSHTVHSVVLTATTDEGAQLEALGEGYPRGAFTGDNAGDSWEFLSVAVARLEGLRMPAERSEAGLLIRSTMEGLFVLAGEQAVSAAHRHPFRGPLLALETALLDLAAKTAGISLTDFLGPERDEVAEIAGPLSGAQRPNELHREAAQPLAWDEEVLPGEERDELLQALLILEHVAADHARRRSEGTAPSALGLDLGGSLDRASASVFIRRMASLAADGRLPRRVAVERPVPRRFRSHLVRLQKEAQAVIDASGHHRDTKFEVLSPWSHWDHGSASTLLGRRGFRTVHVLRPAQQGSVLRTLDAAAEIHESGHDAGIVLADLSGSTETGREILRSVARALPQVDVAVLDASDGPHPVAQVTAEGTGHGRTISYEAIVSEVREMITYPELPKPDYEGRPVAVYDDVDDLHPLGPNGSKGHLLERQALALGLSTTRYSKGAFLASDGVEPPLIFKWSRNPLSSAASLALCTHKEATRMQLQRHGVPVPQGRTFAYGEFGTAKQFVERIGYPVVVKPAMGVRGIGVVAGIQNESELDAAFEIMSSSKLGKQDFIVEKHINGRDYRIVVIGDQVVAAILREPASVFGDGESTVAELLLNKNVARKRNPHLWARPAKYDAAAQHELEKAGLTLSSVPAEGEQVLLANTCSLSQGGDSIDVLDEMHPSILEACVRSVNAVPSMEYCGVDFLLEDHTKPLDEQDAGICELNAHAAIGNCEYPMFGTGRPVAETMMRACVDHYGLDVPAQPAGSVALHLTIRGKVTGVGFRRWLQIRARKAGVTGWVKNVDRKTVEAVIVGETVAATALAASTILGPKKSRPTSYVATHIEDPGLSDFELRESRMDRATWVLRKVRGRTGDVAKKLKLDRVKAAMPLGRA